MDDELMPPLTLKKRGNTSIRSSDGDMASPSKIEVIKQAIKQLMEEVEGDANSSSSDDGDGDDNHHHLLTKLMSQLEEVEPEGLACPALSNTCDDEITTKVIEKEEERILKELKKVKRQNVITHCLLSAMIVLTVVWQISEVSLILKFYNGVSNPFRSVSKVFKTILKKTKAANGNNNEDTQSPSNLIQSSPVHDLKILDHLPVKLPKIDFGFNLQD